MRKTDDRGFTFVELLIAVTILAIITVPLLRIFATVANTNARAKRKLEAAMAAQNLFEELKAADVDTFMQGAVEVPVLDAGGVQKKDADGNGIFMLEKEFDRTVNGKDFHMIVRLDPTSYTTAAGDAGKATDYNSIGYSQLASLSNADTAFLSVDASDVAEAVNELALLEPSGAGSGMDTSDDVRKQEIAAGLTRDITVKITKNSTSGSTSVAARITYTDGAFTCTTREAEIYSNGTNLGNTLSNIFICFNPMYNNPAKGVATETITIDNPENYEVGIYLVKQSDEKDATVAPEAEARYSVNVRISGSSSEPGISVLTNMDYAEGRSDSEMLLTYSGSTLPAGKSLTEMLHVSAGDEGLQNPGAKNRIYEVAIEVYRTKDGGGAATYEAEELLTTLDGTKIE